MNYTTIKLEIKFSGEAWVTLNRPEIHNAFNEVMISEVIDCFSLLEKDESVKTVILTGEGKSFCAGADLNWMKKMKDYSLEENFKDSKELANMFSTINSFGKPVIARVNGHALGGGIGLLSVCDYVLAVESAKLGLTEVKLGLLPAVISPYVIAKIGESYARAFMLTGERFNPATAMRMQLVHKVTTVENLDDDLEEVLKGFRTAGPEASQKAKFLIKQVLTLPENEVEDFTCDLISQTRIGMEGQEGMSALLQKRKPNWI